MSRLRQPRGIGALSLILAAGWVLVTNWSPIVSGHWSYLVFYVLMATLGAVLLWRQLHRGDTNDGTWRVIAAMAGYLLGASICLWLSPFGADQVALSVLDDPSGIVVTETRDAIVISPTGEQAKVGLVFYPGARVDSRAYLAILRPFAEAGAEVAVVKEPLGIAFLGFRFADAWIADRPQIDTWLVGGHSLGGVAASGAATSTAIDGLLLWASFPASDISELETLSVVSVYGTADAIAEADDILASAIKLPPSTEFAPIEGAIHSFFGDYGIQPGDGEPGVERGSAQAQIIEASLVLLQEAVSATQP